MKIEFEGTPEEFSTMFLKQKVEGPFKTRYTKSMGIRDKIYAWLGDKLKNEQDFYRREIIDCFKNEVSEGTVVKHKQSWLDEIGNQFYITQYETNVEPRRPGMRRGPMCLVYRYVPEQR